MTNSTDALQDFTETKCPREAASGRGAAPCCSSKRSASLHGCRAADSPAQAAEQESLGSLRAPPYPCQPSGMGTGRSSLEQHPPRVAEMMVTGMLADASWTLSKSGRSWDPAVPSSVAQCNLQ